MPEGLQGLRDPAHGHHEEGEDLRDFLRAMQRRRGKVPLVFEDESSLGQPEDLLSSLAR